MNEEQLSYLDFPNMDNRYRARLMNALSGFKSVNLLGTQNTKGQTNLAIVSSVIHIGSNPALMGFVMRPVSVTRDSYNNIMSTGFYTFNHITTAFFKAAHQTSARYPEDISEFDEVGLTPNYSKLIPAPYVEESPIKIGLQFREKIDIQLNGTILIIGEIKELFFPKDCLMADGFLDIEKAGTITTSGLDAYHATQGLGRLSYAKPNVDLREIDHQ